MDFNTDFKLSGPLAGLFGGIKEGQQEQARGLQNQFQALQNQQQEYTAAEAQAKLQDPRYIQMKLQSDMSKFGKETSINEIESAYNKANIAVAHLKAAQAQGPEALQQASMQYLQEMNIDPSSQKGQLLLQDPVGSAEKLAQFYATAATNNPDYMQKYSLGEQSAQKAMDVAKLQGENALRVAQLHEGGANARHAGTLSTDKQLNEMITRANNGDVVAQQWINSYVMTKRAANPAFGGMTLNPQGGMQTKGEATQLPFPNAGQGQQPTSTGKRPPLDSFNK